MRELTLAFALFATLAGVAFGVRSTGWDLLAYGGALMVMGGLLFSVPCAIRYHVLLYRTLSPRGELQRHWLRGPSRSHPRLRVEERRRVLPWFYAGAAGWSVAILGCVFLGVAAFVGR